MLHPKFRGYFFSWELEIAELGSLNLFVFVEECFSGVAGYRLSAEDCWFLVVRFLRGKCYPVLTLDAFEGSVDRVGLLVWQSYTG